MDVPLQVADLPVGVVYILAASSLGVYGLVLGGWGSGSKYSLLGALRAAAQVVSYELILGIAIVSVTIVSGTLSLGGIVEAQSQSVWYVVVQPVAFILFMIAAVAETNRRRSICQRPSLSWWRATTPSTAGCASPCTSSRSTWR